MKQLNWYQIFGNAHIIPDGRTVTPTDDIQTLLHCANIWDKSYTTLAEVLADDDTLFLICISNNAIDYLVRSTTWAGVNLVPIMTGSTTPSGEATASAAYDSNTQGWRVFDGNAAMPWVVGSPTRTGWVRYKFTSPVVVRGFSIQNRDEDTTWICSPASFSLQGSNDGNSWTSLGSFTNTNNTRAYKATYTTDNTTAYQYYQVNITDVLQSGGGISIGELQLYSEGIILSESAMQYIGASDYASETLLSDSTWLSAIDGSAYKDYVINASVPTMTSYNTPSGQVIESSRYTTNYGWYAFDQNTNDRWAAGTQNVGEYVGYIFPTKNKIAAVGYYAASNVSYTAQLRGSNDGITWTDIGSPFVIGNSDRKKRAVYDGNKYDRYAVFAVVSGIQSFIELQFYGRQPAGVQSWLKAGGITNKKYTTVSEVLSDLTTLATLMSSTDAIDYLVTAKGWATEICSDSNAMVDIGMNNYAANTLLADETWKEAICNSTYFESVLNGKNPDMTDNTHPYGEVTASAVSSQTPVAASWKAFDDNNETYWNGGGGQYPNNYCRYTFPTSKKMYLIKYRFRGGHSSPFTYTAKFQTSDDGVTWTDATNTYTFAFSSSEAKTGNVILNGNAKRGYGIQILSCNNSAAYSFSVCEMRFYGRKDI